MTKGSAKFSASVLNLLSNKQLESTFFSVQAVAKRLEKRYREEAFPIDTRDVIAAAFGAATNEADRAVLLGNQQAFYEAHPRLGKKAQKKVGSHGPSSKMAKDANVTKLLTDETLTATQTMALIRKTYCDQPTLQLSWKTTAAHHDIDSNTFRIELDITTVITRFAVKSPEAIPHMAKL